MDPGRLLTAVGSTIGSIFKFLFYAAVVMVAMYLLWQHWDRVRRVWRQLLDDIRQFWGRLFGRRSRASQATESAAIRADADLRPFSEFADPFVSGLATRYSAAELIQYSFEAFEAWAREQGCPRRLDQTPHEFAHQVARHRQSLGADANNLALLYSRAAYAQGNLPASAVQQLRRFWSQLRGGPPGR